MNLNWFDKDELFPKVIEQLQKVDIVLDIGCGIRPQNYICPLVHICCEPFEEYSEILIDKANQQTDRHFIVLKAGWEEAVKLFAPKSVDTIFLLDVIEHLEKEKGEELLRLTESIARKQVVIFTPLGYLPQKHPDGIDAWGLNGGAWQEHKSGWLPDDFGELWDIYACKEFHFEHNGEVLDKPYGAFWAIKTIKNNSEMIRIGIVIDCDKTCENQEILTKKLQEKIPLIRNQFTNGSIQIFIILLCNPSFCVDNLQDSLVNTLTKTNLSNIACKELSEKYFVHIDALIIRITGLSKFDCIKHYVISEQLGLDIVVVSDINHYFIQNDTLYKIKQRYEQGYNFIIPRMYTNLDSFHDDSFETSKPIIAISTSLLKRNSVFDCSDLNGIFRDEFDHFLHQAYIGSSQAQIRSLYDTNVLLVYEDDEPYKAYSKGQELPMALTTQWMERNSDFLNTRELLIRHLTPSEYINYPKMNDIQRFMLDFKVLLRKVLKRIVKTAIDIIRKASRNL